MNSSARRRYRSRSRSLTCVTPFEGPARGPDGPRADSTSGREARHPLAAVRRGGRSPDGGRCVAGRGDAGRGAPRAAREARGGRGTLADHATAPRRHRRPRHHHARLRRAGRRAARRVRRLRARRRARRPRARADHQAQALATPRRGRSRSSPPPRAASPRAAATRRSAAAASGRPSPTRRSSSSSSSRWSSRCSGSATSRTIELEPIRGMDDPWRYRNKMEFSFGADEDGRLVLGLHKRGSWRDIVDIVDCELASERMNRARLAVAEACRALGLEPYSREGDGGLLRHLVVREGLRQRRPAAQPVRRRPLPRGGRAGRARRRPQSGCTSFAVTVNETRADAAVGDGPHMLVGPPYLRERLAGVDLRVPATAFLQTNSAMCDVLYETALRFAAPDPARPSVDLYCGIGSLSLPLARGSREVARHRDPGRGDRRRARERRAQRRGQRRRSTRPTCARCCASRRTRARRRARGRRATGPAVVDRRPAARRPGAQGAAARGGPRRRPLRLRLVQPDDARRQRRRARRARLPPRRRWRRSTCSRTRTTSRRSRCSSAPADSRRRRTSPPRRTPRTSRSAFTAGTPPTAAGAPGSAVHHIARAMVAEERRRPSPPRSSPCAA